MDKGHFRLLMFFLIACPASAELKLTPMTDIIRHPDGSLFNGIVRIQLSEAIVTFDGQFVAPELVSISVVAGAFSVSLVPSDSSRRRGNYYEVTYTSSTGHSWKEKWFVHTQVARPTYVRIATPPD